MVKHVPDHCDESAEGSKEKRQRRQRGESAVPSTGHTEQSS